MKMSPIFLLLTAVPTLVAFGCGGGRRDPSTKAPAASVRPPVSVATVAVARDSASLVQVPARIRSRQQAVISGRISALVVSTPFREGDAVRAGETLVRLDDAPQRAAVAAAETQLSTAESESRRISRLLLKGAGTAREADEAEARLEDARAALAAARDLLASTSLRAPFDGRVVSRSVSPGDLAYPGVALLELQGGSALELVATLESSAIRSLRLGQKLRVRVDGVELPVDATIHSVAPAADETTHRVDILCNLARSPGLKPGLFARVELPVGPGSEPGPLGVPDNAVLRRGGLTGVFVVRDGRAWLRWIALGREGGERVEVRAGLAEGERVVANPSGLVDGVAVVERLK
jgi:RND family efflux transporter MFP subunit